jgi:hypothetical protein
MYFNSKYRRTQRSKRKKNKLEKERGKPYFRCRTEKYKDLRERAEN